MKSFDIRCDESDACCSEHPESLMSFTLRSLNPHHRRAILAAASVVLAMGCVDDADKSSETDKVEADTDTDTDTDSAPECATASPDDLFDCCDRLAEWCQTHFTDHDDQMDCQFGPDFDGSTGCIPWGPPVPPRMVA
jgi:hypothetical protein